MVKRKRKKEASTFYLYALFNAVVTSPTLMYVYQASFQSFECQRIVLSVCPLQFVE